MVLGGDNISIYGNNSLIFSNNFHASRFKSMARVEFESRVFRVWKSLRLVELFESTSRGSVKGSATYNLAKSSLGSANEKIYRRLL